MELWIYFTVLAAFMQAVRTAGQKQLSHHLDAIATTLVRFLFALPIVWLYLGLVKYHKQLEFPAVNYDFIQLASLAAIAQIVGTAFTIKAFSYQNFAVATSLVKTEAILTALLGVLMFDAVLSGFGWISVVIGGIAVLLLSNVDKNLMSIFKSPAALFGVGAGLCFALASLWIREASLILNTDLLLSAAYTLAFTVTLQSVIIVVYLLIKDKNQFTKMTGYWKLCWFVGATSALGSIGWFTASSLQTVAYVKALGQIDFFFTLIITLKIFKESISVREYLGMFLILVSVMILLLLA
ncbi:MAG: DMT family transporter [Kangiellaceae bacterium]